MAIVWILSNQTRKRKFNQQAAILDFRLPVWSQSIQATCNGLLDPENMRVAVGISFLFRLQAKGIGSGPLSSRRHEIASVFDGLIQYCAILTTVTEYSKIELYYTVDVG
jgi:hypothetical protein